MKRNLLLLLLSILLTISVPAFAGHQDNNFRNEDFDQLLSQVISGEKGPDSLTDKVIVKEYDYVGNFEYKSILKSEYNKLKLKISGNNHKNIEYIQPDFIRYSSYEIGEYTNLSWGKDRIGSQNLINVVGDTSNEVIVAVLDTGVDYNHELLRNRLVEGYNFVDDNNDPMDINSHGTHVAGIIVDSTNHNVKIMPVKVLADDGLGLDSSIANGIYYAVNNGADVINMSLGGPGYSSHMAEAIKFAISKDVLVVVAAGNESSNTKDFYPSSEELALVVSATDESDNFADFSNYGTSVDIAAPGVSIYSSIPNNGYKYFNGTSMATPYISALGALIKQEDLNRSIHMIEDILKIHTDDLGKAGKDDYFGEGIANVSNYSTESEDFILISPLNNTIHDESITVKYYTSNSIGSDAIIKINEEIKSLKHILEDGYKNEYISLKDMEAGSYILSISIVRDHNTVFEEKVNITIEEINTTFKALDYKSDLQNSFVVSIYGIKDNVVKNFETGLDSQPLYWINSMGGEIRENLDYDNLLSTYDSLVIVASDISGSTMPVYVRELTGPGNYLFKPDNLQKLTFRNDVEIHGYGTYSSNILPTYDGIMLPWSGSGTYVLGEEAVLYMDEGSHFVYFSAFHFTLSGRVNGTGETNFVLNENNSTKINLIGDSSLDGVDGLYKGNSVMAWLFDRSDRRIPLSAPLLNPGINSHILYNKDYTVNFIKEAPNKGTIRLYKDFTADENINNSNFEYGGTLDTEFVLSYNDNNLKGEINIGDNFNNRVILSNSFYDMDLLINSLSKIDPSINFNPSSFNYESYAILEDIESGRQYKTLIDGNNKFLFNQSIPDGNYLLYTDFHTTIFSYEIIKINIIIMNNTFISDKYDDPQDHDIIMLDKMYNIPLSKVWTIAFNRSFRDDEIIDIKIMKDNKEIPILISYQDISKVTIQPIDIYKKDSNYYIIVTLTNGNKYKMPFETIK